MVNERNLYYRPCHKTGKTIVSNYAPESHHTVYYSGFWLSSDWDAMEYAQDLNFEEPFFAQFRRLFDRVPRMSMDQANVENSDFNNHVENLRNCYMCVQCGNLQDCAYDSYTYDTKTSHDSMFLSDGESCYACLHCANCYEVFFAENTRGSATSMFLKNCESVRDCLLCVNLRQKQYCVRNKQVTKEEYEAEREILLERLQREPEAVHAEFDALIRSLPQPPHLNRSCEDCQGEYLEHCKSCTDVYLGIRSENVHHAYWFVDSRDCLDVQCFALEHSYFSQITGGTTGNGSYNCSMCLAAWENCKDVFYSDYCFFSCESLFGCVGLKRKKYCILNKQYTKEEYEILVPKLIAHMQQTGEWGEFFPLTMSPFAYNESMAHVYAPLSEEQAKARGLRWRVMEGQSTQGREPVTVEPIAAYNDKSKADALLKQVLICRKTGRAYRIIPMELAFLLKHGLPIPDIAPQERYLDAYGRLNQRQQSNRACMNPQRYDTGAPCQNIFWSSHPEGGDAVVYCEECYRAASL